MAAMRRAASGENFLLRVADVPAVIDALTKWNAASSHPLSGALDLSRLGMSGHSFGAVTTQAVTGQAIPGGRTPYLDTRIKAAVIMSPSAPRNGSAKSAFGNVTMPWLLMTGTKDEAAIGDASVDDRLAVYPALPAGGKYELVLHDAEHSAFGDRPLPGDKADARNPNHHRAILATSTAFWDAWLLGNADARAWLDGAAVRAVLEPKDRWQRK
jgi:predicted dienelactone hydrolase